MQNIFYFILKMDPMETDDIIHTIETNLANLLIDPRRDNLDVSPLTITTIPLLTPNHRSTCVS